MTPLECGWRRVAAAALCTVALACAQGRPDRSLAPDLAGAPRIEWTAVAPQAEAFYAPYSRFVRDTQFVIRTQSAWDSVWPRLLHTVLVHPPQPSIDFRHELLVIVAAGRSGNADAIRIDSISIRGDTLDVLYRKRCVASPTMMDSYPAHIVRVKRVDGPVTFVEAVGEDCRDRGGD